MRSFGPDNLIEITWCGSPSKRKVEQKRKRGLQKKIPRLSDQEFSFFNAAYKAPTAATLSQSTQCARIGLEENSSFHRQSPSNIRSLVVRGLCVPRTPSLIMTESANISAEWSLLCFFLSGVKGFERTAFAGVTAYRCGATATSLSSGTDRHWTGFAPSPS